MRRLTAEETERYAQAHLDRLKIINKPFPRIRIGHICGAIWAGVLIERDADSMYLKQHRVARREENSLGHEAI